MSFMRLKANVGRIVPMDIENCELLVILRFSRKLAKGFDTSGKYN